mgnify:CR=1 FL=1
MDFLKPKKRKATVEGIEENDKCFLFFISKYIAELELKNKFGQLKIAKSRLKKLQRFCKKSSISFDKLDIEFWTKYVQWCQKKGNKDVTIIGNLKFFSARFKEAFSLGLHSEPSPFRLAIKRCNLNAEGVVVIPVSKHELKRIESLELSGFAAKARRIFVFSCYTGISFSDVVLLSPKLKSKEQYQKIESLNTQTNTALEIICSRAEIYRKITFHDARRCFAKLRKTS